MEPLEMELDTLKDLLHRTTGNPIAEDEIPKMIKDILKSGGTVQCTLDDLIIPVILEDEQIKFDIAHYKNQ